MAGWPSGDFDAPEIFERVEYVMQTTDANNPQGFTFNYQQQGSGSGVSFGFDAFEAAMQSFYDDLVAWKTIHQPNATVQKVRSFYAAPASYGFRLQGDTWPEETP